MTPPELASSILSLSAENSQPAVLESSAPLIVPLPAKIVAPDRAAHASPLSRGAALVGANFVIAILFVITLLVVVLVYGGTLKWKEGPILISGGITLGILALRFAWEVPALLRGTRALSDVGPALLRTLYDWGPLVIVMWMFENLEPYTGVIRTTVFDTQLYDLDVRLFGVEPTVWIGRFSHPLLTDWMSIAYGLYFITPMVLATTLSLRERRADFTEMITACVVQMGLGFIICLFVPRGAAALYPALLDGGFQPAHLHSLTGLMELQQGAFDTADPSRTHSAFPSLHCSLATLTLVFAWRYGDAVFPRHRRRFARIVTFLVVSLWISTVYLRHHWFVDCVAGVLLGLVSTLVAHVVRRRWPRAPVATPTSLPS